MSLEIRDELILSARRETDLNFKNVFLLQWVCLALLTAYLNPLTWNGEASSLNPNLFIALALGGVLALFPVWMISLDPGKKTNMYVVTVCQMLFSVLFIHFTHGRIESHFHVFGSLAFLAAYNHKPLIYLATGITLIDHVVRGAVSPEFVYGVSDASLWRALEHAVWVIFEDVFLLASIGKTQLQIEAIAKHRSALEGALSSVESEVKKRTQELEASKTTIIEQQQSLLLSSRLNSLGEMAGGVAHEINNPLAIISATLAYLRKQAKKGPLTQEHLEEAFGTIEQTISRITKIITGLRNISRSSEDETFDSVYLPELMEDVLSVCEEKLRLGNVKVQVDDRRPHTHAPFLAPRVQISQVLLNLITNAFDALKESPEKRITIEAHADASAVTLKVIDSGSGIRPELREKIFLPFYTTKGVGHGTGLGLSISQRILQRIGGELFLEDGVPQTTFVLKIPQKR